MAPDLQEIERMTNDTQTHTLPLMLMAVLVIVGIAALVLLYRSRQRLLTLVEEEFTKFREKAVSLMDQLDALRKRHKTLAAEDPDFVVPMAGATLALYNTVESDLNVLWERWLQVMELWDHAQKLVRSGSALSVRQAEEARKLLDKGDIDDLFRQSGSCKERLDRLNQGHEKARADLEAARTALAGFRQSIDKGTGVLIPSDPYRAEISRAETMLAQAEPLITADPMGAQELIALAHRSAAGLTDSRGNERTGRLISRGSYSLLDDLAEAANRFRAAAAKLRLTNLLGLFARFWMIVWGLSLLIALLDIFMPLLILVLGMVFVLAGFWAIWQLVTFWLWYGLWGSRR
jgi:hypothetical protein